MARWQTYLLLMANLLVIDGEIANLFVIDGEMAKLYLQLMTRWDVRRSREPKSELICKLLVWYHQFNSNKTCCAGVPK